MDHINLYILSYNIGAIKAHCQNTSRYNEEINSSTKPTGCFEPVDEIKTIGTYITSIENPLPKTAIGCIEIGIDLVHKDIPKGYEKYEETGTNKVSGCFELVEQSAQVLLTTQEKVLENNNGRYNGPKARNWKEFEKDCPIGQQYGDKFIPTGKQNPKDGSPIRRLSEDVPKAEMFKKGYQFA